MLIDYTMWSSNRFCCIQLFLGFFIVQDCQSPDFSGSRFCRVQVFRVQVFRVRVQRPSRGSGSSVRVQGPGPGSESRVQVQGLGPGYRSSRSQTLIQKSFQLKRHQFRYLNQKLLFRDICNNKGALQSTILTWKYYMNSVQKFIEVQGWLLLTLSICLHNQLSSFNSIIAQMSEKRDSSNRQ